MSKIIESRDDSYLLSQIHRKHCHHSFEELFSRYEKRSFGLAYHLSGSSDTAKDIVQDAMITIWKKAGTFDAKRGLASAWILRIVANTALKARRKNRSIEKIEDGAAANRSRETNSVVGIGEQEALQLNLQTILKTLPDIDRQMIVLYFGGGLSQYDIARHLSLSQRTISEKMKKALEKIRLQLVSAGFSAISVDAITVALTSFIQDSTPVPANLFLQVSKKLHESVSNKTVGATGTRGLIWITSAALLMLMGGSFWLSEPYTSPEAQTNSNAIKEHQQASSEFKKPPTTPLRYSKWEFTTPAPKEFFKINGGAWRHAVTSKGKVKGFMVTDESVQIRLNWHQPPGPFAITCTYTLVPGKGVLAKNGKQELFNFLIGPSNKDTIEAGEIQNLFPILPKLSESKIQWKTVKKIFFNNFELMFSGHKKHSLAYRKIRKGSPLYLKLDGGTCLASVEIRELRPDEIPKLDAVRTAVNLIPAHLRKGRVALPKLKSCHASQPVQIIFLAKK